MPDTDPVDLVLYKNLCLLAVRMRRAQIEYFASRSQGGLVRAKELERHFDQHAREVFGDAGEVRQPGAR